MMTVRQRPAPETRPAIARVSDIYRDLGVEPFINCAGVRTNYGGSNACPEVVKAMAEANQAFVDLDELAEGVGRRLAALSGAEWGIVTAGTAAALALATAACLAGNDPELMLNLPHTSGQGTKVLIPDGHRFAYEQAIRLAGGDILPVTNAADLSSMPENSVAMIGLLGRKDRAGQLGLDALVPWARTRAIPIVVDAAGLSPCCPDPWIARGADLVIYAGGKYLRAPQSTALVLGAQRLCRAMWLNGPPHQSFGRSMKVGKDEIVGAMVAFDRWMNSDNAAAERSQWLPRLRRIAAIVAPARGITTEILSSPGSVTAIRLKIAWDARICRIDAEALRQSLLNGRPRILIHDFWSTPTSIVIDPVNLGDEEAEIVAGTLLATFSAAQEVEDPVIADAAPQIDVGGHWRVRLKFLHGSATHDLELVQDGAAVRGIHRGRLSVGDVTGTVCGRAVALDVMHDQQPMRLFYRFAGHLDDDDRLKGTVALGAAAPEHTGPVFRRQFGQADWAGVRRR